jgi:uncharacterized UBP type Zn finger protein
MPEAGCAHLDAIDKVRLPKVRECEDCVKIGADWVHLRTCQKCGGTRCCDDSPNRHATRHAKSTGHPVIASAEQGERWLYCYPHDSLREY